MEMSNKLLQSQTITLQLLNQAIDNLSVSLIITDKEGKLISWNDAAEQLLKIHIDSNIEWIKYFEVYNLDNIKCKNSENPIVRALKGDEIKGERILLKNKYMEEGIPLAVDSFPLMENGEIVGAVGVFTDIKDKVKMENLFSQVAEKFEDMKLLLEKSIRNGIH